MKRFETGKCEFATQIRGCMFSAEPEVCERILG